MHQDPGEEMHHAIDSTPCRQWYEDCYTHALVQQGGQADSRGGRDFKQKVITENSEEI